MDKNLAQQLINKTRTDYNRISDHFSSTRSTFNWDRVIRVLESLELKPSSKLLDLGCGNGRALDILKKYNINYTGLDLSENLIKLAKKKYPTYHFQIGDLLKTPFVDDTFDYVLSVATLHHIPSKEERLKAFKEINRILKPNGQLILTVWYFWSDTRLRKLIYGEFYKKLQGKSNLDFGDFLKPWKDQEKKILVERYFHAYRKSEMKNLLKESGFDQIGLTDNKEDQNNNLIVTARKII